MAFGKSFKNKKRKKRSGAITVTPSHDPPQLLAKIPDTIIVRFQIAPGTDSALPIVAKKPIPWYLENTPLPDKRDPKAQPGPSNKVAHGTIQANHPVEIPLPIVTLDSASAASHTLCIGWSTDASGRPRFDSYRVTFASYGPDHLKYRLANLGYLTGFLLEPIDVKGHDAVAKAERAPLSLETLNLQQAAMQFQADHKLDFSPSITVEMETALKNARKG